jgi:hypothetical protein
MMRQRSLQNGKSADVSESTGLPQMGHFHFMKQGYPEAQGRQKGARLGAKQRLKNALAARAML